MINRLTPTHYKKAVSSLQVVPLPVFNAAGSKLLRTASVVSMSGSKKKEIP